MRIKGKGKRWIGPRTVNGYIDPVDDNAGACDRRSCHGERPVENENPSAKRKISIEGKDTNAIVEPPCRPPTFSKSTEKTPKAYNESDDCWIRGQGLGDENQ
jgi:hypothetical protein